MQIGFDVGATKIESVVLKDNGEEADRNRINCPKDYHCRSEFVILVFTHHKQD